jgi:hypothetical protein
LVAIVIVIVEQIVKRVQTVLGALGFFKVLLPIAGSVAKGLHAFDVRAWVEAFLRVK